MSIWRWVELIKFDTGFLWVLVKYNCILVIFVLIHLTRLIMGHIHVNQSNTNLIRIDPFNYYIN